MGIAAADTAVDAELEARATDEAAIGITITDSLRPDDPLISINDAVERGTGSRREAVLSQNS